MHVKALSWWSGSHSEYLYVSTWDFGKITTCSSSCWKNWPSLLEVSADSGYSWCVWICTLLARVHFCSLYWLTLLLDLLFPFHLKLMKTEMSPESSLFTEICILQKKPLTFSTAFLNLKATFICLKWVVSCACLSLQATLKLEHNNKCIWADNISYLSYLWRTVRKKYQQKITMIGAYH